MDARATADRPAACWPSRRASGCERVLRYAARRGRVPLALRHPLALAGPRGAALRLHRATARRTRVRYAPGESDSGMFGGNSNWRGPGLVPDQLPAHRGAASATTTSTATRFKVECPDRLGTPDAPWREVADELCERLIALFLPDDGGRRPVPRRERALRRRSALAGTCCSSTNTSTATPARPRRRPPDRLDRPGGQPDPGSPQGSDKDGGPTPRGSQLNWDPVEHVRGHGVS